MYSKDMLELLEGIRPLIMEGSRIMIKRAVLHDIACHAMLCDDFNKWFHGLGIKDLKVEEADMDEDFLVLHKDSREYELFRVVEAL